MPTATSPHSTVTCPSWCAVEHTWDGPEFHKSDFRTVDDFGDQIRANLFQAIGEGCEVRVMVSGGGAMTPGKASDFARDLLDLASAARGQKVNGD